MVSLQNTNNVTSIGNYAFKGCSSAFDASFDNVKSINEGSFNGTGVRNVSMNSLVSIPNISDNRNAVFRNARSLKSVSISSCTYIGKSSFMGCSSLEYIHMPLCATIAGEVFSGCSNLHIELSLPLIKIVEYTAFANSGIIGVDFQNVTSIPKGGDSNTGVFSRCTFLKTVNIPLCTSVGAYAFNNCSSISYISMPVCTYIGKSAFLSCSGLRHVYFPLVKTIEAESFLSSGIESIELPSIQALGSSTYSPPFQRCGNLQTVMLGSGITAVGVYPFRYASLLKTLVVKATTPPSSDRVFQDCNSVTAFVPMDSVSAYQSASGWSGYASRIKGYLEADELPVDNTNADLYFIGDLFYRWENNQWVLKNDQYNMAY